MSDTINNINTEGGPVIQGGTFFGATFVAKQYVNAQPEKAAEKPMAIEAEEVEMSLITSGGQSEMRVLD